MDIKVLFDEETINNRLIEMAEQIDKDYENEEIIAIFILRGAVYFATDLTKKMKTPMVIDFIKCESYVGTETTGKINLILDNREHLEGKHVIIFEDIIDTGYTLNYLKEYILFQNPKSLKIAVLLDKKERRKVDLEADYVGFEIPNKFVVGYGLDGKGSLYRNLPYVGYFEE